MATAPPDMNEQLLKLGLAALFASPPKGPDVARLNRVNLDLAWVFDQVRRRLIDSCAKEFYGTKASC
jgi:hypothetical protein